MRHTHLLVFCLLLVAMAAPRTASACAPAPMDGEHVAIEGEDAIIIWDPGKGVEHFIRRANFATKAKRFGFIVPTPAKPTLHAIDDAVFGQLQGIVARDVEVVTKRKFRPTACAAYFMVAGSAPDGAKAVRVLDRQRVAGYDAVVLDAKDGNALTGWLEKNDYARTPKLAKWAQHYIDAGWVFTAFKMVAKEGEGLSTSAVRMTFPTKRPFYPYREPPEEKLPPSRSLRVFFIAPGRHDGALDGGAPWPGKTKYARPLTATLRDGSELVPAGAWLTEVLDQSNPRPRDGDVSFSAAKSAEELRHTRVRRSEIPIPIDLLLLVALAGWLIRKRWLKRKAASSA